MFSNNYQNRTSIFGEIRESFRKGSILTKLIYINLGVFLGVNIIYVIYVLFNPMGLSRLDLKFVFEDRYLSWFMVPSNLGNLLLRPWTIFTYMFLHFGFWHILFNILWLYMFGRIFLMFLTEKQLFSTYVLGGFAGAILFILAYNIFPGLVHLMPDSRMMGASAGVMGVAMAISFYHPNYTVYLLFLGPVRLKYIALFFILTDIIQIASVNAGGHIAHLGGIVYGYFFATLLRGGKDPGHWFNQLVDQLVTVFKGRRGKIKVSYRSEVTGKATTDKEYNRQRAASQAEIDRILDKIAQSGYDSLSKSEKETLFRMSNKF